MFFFASESTRQRHFVVIHGVHHVIHEFMSSNSHLLKIKSECNLSIKVQLNFHGCEITDVDLTLLRGAKLY